MKYVICKNKHNSIGNKLRFHRGLTTYYFNTRIGTDWFNKYPHGINKLCGFTMGGLFDRIHRNSIRIGWKPSNDLEEYINLYLYWYDEKVSLTYQSRFICKAKADTIVRGVIKPIRVDEIDNITVDLCVGTTNYTLTIPYHLPDKLWGRFCYPYYGGPLTSPNTKHFSILQHM